MTSTSLAKQARRRNSCSASPRSSQSSSRRLSAASAALAIALLLAGCASRQLYSHPTKDEVAFQQDLYDCERDAAPVADARAHNGMMDRCMRVKGWQPQ